MTTTLLHADELFHRVEHVVPAAEWATMADDVNAIMRLKAERNAVILAHNYMRPEIFHGVADIVGEAPVVHGLVPKARTWPIRTE